MSRVLVVEDSRTQAREIQYVLEDEGFTVEVVGDGLDALAAIRRQAPDLIVTDLRMPRMDGLALVEAVRHDFPFVPVVLITAFGSETIAARALREGAAGYVPKRYLGLDLVPTVRNILALTEGRDGQRRVLGQLIRSESEFVLDNDLTVIPPLVRYFEEILAETLFDDSTELIRIGVALREALVNAIDHGSLEINACCRELECEHSTRQQDADRRRSESPYRDRRVHLTARIEPPEAVFTIRDEGPGFPVTELPDHSDPANLACRRSRGLQLIRTFMDAVTHNMSGNEIRLVKRAQIVRPGRAG